MEKKDFMAMNAVFVSWDTISALCSMALQQILQRPITVYATSSEPHLRGWFLLIEIDSRLTKKEADILLTTVEADDYDWDANDFGEYPVAELTSAVALKLLKKMKNIKAEWSFPEDDGVWLFTGQGTARKYHMLIEYPETDCRPDVLVFQSTMEKADVLKTVENLKLDMEQLQEENGETDRLTRLDLFAKTLGDKINAEVSVFALDQIESI